MISNKRFFTQTRKNQVLFLSLLSCLVALVLFFSYNPWQRFDVSSLHFTGTHIQTQTDTEGPSIPGVTISHNDPKEEAIVINHKHNETSKLLDLSRLKYVIILPTYVRFYFGYPKTLLDQYAENIVI